MYGAILVLFRYGRLGEILHEDFVVMDPIRGFNTQIRQESFIFVRENISRTPHMLSKPHILAIL